MDERQIIKKFIVRKLYRKRMWLHKHTNIHNLPKGLSNELSVSREVKKAVDDLLKEQILLSKPTHYGLEISLNSKKIKEIEELVQ
jgi:cell division protein FtsL